MTKRTDTFLSFQYSFHTQPHKYNIFQSQFLLKQCRCYHFIDNIVGYTKLGIELNNCYFINFLLFDLFYRWFQAILEWGWYFWFLFADPHFEADYAYFLETKLRDEGFEDYWLAWQKFLGRVVS